LGCQALAEFVGGRLYNQQEVAHGIEREASREGKSWLLKGLPDSFPVGLYHSWAIENSEQLNQEFKVVAWRDGKIPMAMEHHRLPIAGVQFHPESIMSEGGMEILANWLKRA
jgi:anthranilate/para-aminobenzoate synthase component II